MTNPTPHGQVPEAHRLADWLQNAVATYPQTSEDEPGGYCQEVDQVMDEAAAELRRLHAYCQELESQVIRDCMTHVQNPAENEHIADDMSKNEMGSNMSTQPVAQQGAAYAALPEPLEIDWPELHSQALGCGVEDRGLHSRYECAEYGWQDGVDKCAERVPEQIFDADQMRAFADATHTLRIASHGQAPAQPAVKYVPVKADLRDKHWNHPRDDEPRIEACQKALRDRGDDEGQGLDGYWKWGFAAGFNAALATTPSPQAAQQAPAGAAPECLTCSDHGAVGNILTAEPCPDCTRLNAQPAPATQQAGWKCAPVEPTDAMVQAAHHIDLSYMPGQEGADRAAIYRAMLAAAPQQEAQEPAAVVVPCHTPSGKRVALYSAKQDLPIGTKLYTGPQPSPTAQAAECVPAVDGALEVADAMVDSQYLAGVSAGWNAANADDPNAALQKLHASRAGYLKPLVAARDPAESVLEDAARLERERICAAIKAEDDYCVDHGDYMLDSDDCIKIVRGEWVRPDFSVDAARKQGANHDNS